jgi:hypothetical protein
MKTLNTTQQRLLTKGYLEGRTNVAGFLVSHEDDEETLYAMSLGNGCFKKARGKRSNIFGSVGFFKCDTIPDEAVFCGYYKINNVK